MTQVVSYEKRNILIIKMNSVNLPIRHGGQVLPIFQSCNFSIQYLYFPTLVTPEVQIRLKSDVVFKHFAELVGNAML